MTTIGKHTSFWQETYKLPSYPTFQGSASYDVAVIGGGITGLTTALNLKRAGKRVAVLEKIKLGASTSGGTSAHLTTNPDFGFTNLTKNFGVSGAKTICQAMKEGVDIIERNVKELNIDCDFRRVPGYLYACKESDSSEVEKEFKSSQEAGQNCELLDRAPLPFPTFKTMMVHNQAEFHATKYLGGLAAAIQGDGCDIFEGTTVTDYHEKDKSIVTTDYGKIECDDIVVATHTPLGIHILHSEVAPYRSYVIAARIRGEYPEGLFWDTEEPYHYIRTYRQPNGESYLIVGGADHKTGHPKSSETEHYEALERYAKERFDIIDIPYKWSAQFYDPSDGLPYIGRGQMRKHIYLATGFSGDGLTWGSVGAQIIADEILNNVNKYSSLVRPSRFKPLASAKEFITENLDVAYQYISGWLHSEDESTLKPGESRVVQIGTKKVAIHKDRNGVIHKCSAVCTHMKAIVRWNAAEETWDCPAHGGRYTKDGKRLEGPPMHDLEDLGEIVSHKE